MTRTKSFNWRRRHHASSQGNNSRSVRRIDHSAERREEDQPCHLSFSRLLLLYLSKCSYCIGLISPYRTVAAVCEDHEAFDLAAL